MKTLYLLRHAKSSWGDPNLADHERPLNGRGQAAAEAMGRHFSGQIRSGFPAPDAILASTALRVAETLALLRPAAGLAKVPVTRERGLYLAEPGALLARLHQAPADAATVLMVGHNPGIHEFALMLAGEVSEDNRALREGLRAGYPTAALAAIVFARAESWRDVGWGDGSLTSFTTPKSLI